MQLILSPNKCRSLARIETMTSDKWLQIKLGQFPESMKTQLLTFLKPLSGESVTDDDVILLCAFNKTTRLYEQSYSPSIYADESGNPCVAFNKTLFPLTKELLKTFDAEIAIVELERYDTLCLNLTCLEPEYLEFPLPIKLNPDNYKIPLGEVKALLKGILSGKKKLTDFGKILNVKVYKEGDSDADYTKPLTLKEVDVDTPYYVMGSEKINFGSHENYVLTMKEALSATESFRLYSPKNLAQSLDSGAKLCRTDDEATNTRIVVIESVNKKGEATREALVEPLNWEGLDLVTF